MGPSVETLAPHAIDAIDVSVPHWLIFHTGELIFGEIAADKDGAARLRYVRSIFDPEASVRRPTTLPTSYPQASHFSNFANLYNLRTTYGGDRPAAEASPGMPQEKWMVTQEA